MLYQIITRASSTDVTVLKSLHVGHMGCGVSIVDDKKLPEFDQLILKVRVEGDELWDRVTFEALLNRLMNAGKIIWWTPANGRVA